MNKITQLPRLILADVDGTLVYPGRKIPSTRCVRALEALRARGVPVAICSGRGVQAVRPQAMGGLVTDYRVCYNGAQVLDAQGKVLFEQRMTLAQLQGLVDFFDAAGGSLGFSFSDGYYTYVNHDEFFAFYKQHNGDTDCFYNGEQRVRHETDLPFSAWGMLPPEQAYRYNTLNTGLRMTCFAGRSHDICQANVNKSVGAAALCRCLGVAPHEVLAVGDGENDMELLRFAGMGVAMGNASDALKQIAWAVAPDVREDGAALLFEKLLQCEQA